MDDTIDETTSRADVLASQSDESPDAPLNPAVPQAPYFVIYEELMGNAGDYFNKNRDLLEGNLVSRRASQLLEADPTQTLDSAYDSATAEFEAWMNPSDEPPADDPQPPPQVIPTTALDDSWTAKSIASHAMRIPGNLAAGVSDFALEMTSAAGRALDWCGEAVGLDVFDDDTSWVYAIKEGLDDDTKEYLQSWGGRFTQSDSSALKFAESIGTIAVGAFLLSKVAAVGAATRLGQAVAGSRPVAALTNFLGNHQRLQTVANLSLKGAMVDASSTVFADPSSMVHLLGVVDKDKGAALEEWFSQLDPTVRRGINFGEGLFMNLMIGSLGSIAKRSTASAEKALIEEVVSDTDEILKVYRTLESGVESAAATVKLDPEAVLGAVPKATKVAPPTADTVEAALKVRRKPRVRKADRLKRAKEGAQDGAKAAGEKAAEVALKAPPKGLPEFLDLGATGNGKVVTIGNRARRTGITTTNAIDEYLVRKLRGDLRFNAMGNIDLSDAKVFDGISMQYYRDRLQQLNTAVREAIQETAPGKTYEEAYRSLTNKAIELKGDTAKVIDALVDSKAGREAAKINRLKKARGGEALIPAELLASSVAKGLSSVLRLGYSAVEKSGFIGGMAAGSLSNYLGYDWTQDGKVDLRDAMAVALAWKTIGYMGSSGARKAAAKEALDQRVLLQALERGTQDIHTVYHAASSLVEHAKTLPGISEGALANANRISRQIERYFFGTPAGAKELVNHPTVLASIGRSAFGLDDKGVIKSINAFDLSTPDVIHKNMETLTKQLLPTSKGADPGVINKMLGEFASNLGVSADAMESVWKTMGASERYARMQATQQVLGQLDKQLMVAAKDFQRATPAKVQEFMMMINQRRSVVEYVKGGFDVSNGRLASAVGLQNRNAILSLSPEDFIKRNHDWQASASTAAIVANKLSIGKLEGQKLTEFLGAMGENLSAGEMFVHTTYNFMLSNILTPAVALVENAVGLHMGVKSEMVSALSRGPSAFHREIVSKNGLLSGLANNFFSAFKHAGDAASGLVYKMDAGVGKEMMDIRTTSYLSTVEGLGNANMLNRVFQGMSKMMGTQPTDLVSAPDVFFRHIAFGGYTNQGVAQAAFDYLGTKEGASLSFEQAVAAIRSNGVAMRGITEAAMKKARDVTYTTVLEEGSKTGAAVDFLSHWAPRIAIPFIKTPLVQARHVVRHVPVLNMLVGEDRRAIGNLVSKWQAGEAISAVETRAAQDVIGRSVSGLLTGMAGVAAIGSLGWEIIGTGEFDPGMGAKRARGARMYSLWNPKTGESVSMERMGAAKTLLAAWADIGHYWNSRSDQPEDPGLLSLMGTTLGYGFYSLFVGAQPGQTNDFATLINGLDSTHKASAIMGDTLGSVVARMIPNNVRAEGTASDPYRRAYEGPLTAAVNALYAGMGDLQKARPQLGIYGDLVDKPRSIVGTPGVPGGDELLDQAQAAGYDLQGMLSRRSRVGGLRLGSTAEEQDIKYMAEKTHGEWVKKMRKQFLGELKMVDDPALRKELFSQFFSQANSHTKMTLMADKRVGATVRRLLEGVGKP